VLDIIGKRRWFYAISLAVTIPGLIFIILTFVTAGKVGLQFSIDYTGGTRWVVKFDDPNVTAGQVQQLFVDQGYESTTVFVTADGSLEIRTEPLGLQAAPSPSASPSPGASSSPSADASAAASATASASASPEPSSSPGPSPSPSPSASPAGSASPGASPSASPGATISAGTTPTSGPLGDLATEMTKEFGAFDTQLITTIGPVVSADLIQQALVLILVGALGILLWVTFRFHDVKFGVTALVALLHDVIVVVGIFAILGTFFRVEIDGLFVTAMLTVIGFSVHDTIVVFDRIRENKARHAGEPFDDVVNHSILQTLGRSLLTSFTVVLTLMSLLLFGGPAIRYFVLALLIGVLSGTYSSIFNASPLLVDWQHWEDRRRGRVAGTRAQRRATT
jgi:preprotein translocase SecF subunit